MDVKTVRKHEGGKAESIERGRGGKMCASDLLFVAYKKIHTASAIPEVTGFLLDYYLWASFNTLLHCSSNISLQIPTPRPPVVQQCGSASQMINAAFEQVNSLLPSICLTILLTLVTSSDPGFLLFSFY